MIEKMKDMPQLKQDIVVFLFDKISNLPRDKWHHFECELKYDDIVYDLSCDCSRDETMFSYRNLNISHKQIVIDVDDMMRRGLLE